MGNLATDILLVKQDIEGYKINLARLEMNGYNFGNNDHYKEIVARLEGKRALLARLELRQKEATPDA